MPKFPKTTKVQLWRQAEPYQDAAGAWHQPRPTHIADYWACFRGISNELLFQQTGKWAKPTISLTITRPKHNAPRLDDRIRYSGCFYRVREANDLTGQVGHDMKLVCELDENYPYPE